MIELMLGIVPIYYFMTLSWSWPGCILDVLHITIDIMRDMAAACSSLGCKKAYRICYGDNGRHVCPAFDCQDA